MNKLKGRCIIYNGSLRNWSLSKIIVVIALLAVSPIMGFGQEYPAKPINVTVAVAVGGVADTSLRILAAKAEKFLGQPIVVSNNGGGAGSVALGILAKAKPDGYHIVMAPTPALVEVPQMRKMDYKIKDFDIIMLYAEPATGLAVKIDAPWNNFKDLVEYAKKNPGKVSYTISGSLNPMHIAMMYVAKKEGIQWTAVPVPGADTNMPVLGGHVTAVSSGSAWKAHIDAGKFKLLVTYGGERMPAFPNVPTLKELGYDFVAKSSYMLVAPANTPAPIVKKLNEAFKKAMEDPEFTAYVNKIALPVKYQNSRDALIYIEDANKRFADLIVELNLPKE